MLHSEFRNITGIATGSGVGIGTLQLPEIPGQAIHVRMVDYASTLHLSQVGVGITHQWNNALTLGSMQNILNDRAGVWFSVAGMANKTWVFPDSHEFLIAGRQGVIFENASGTSGWFFKVTLWYDFKRVDLTTWSLLKSRTSYEFE